MRSPPDRLYRAAWGKAIYEQVLTPSVRERGRKLQRTEKKNIAHKERSNVDVNQMKPSGACSFCTAVSLLSVAERSLGASHQRRRQRTEG